MTIPRRTLRRLEGRRVICTLDNDSGVRGLVGRVYRDHVVLLDAQGIAIEDGVPVSEAQVGAVDVVPLKRIVRFRMASE